MTSVVLNKVGMDLVDIEVQQKGTAFTDIFFQDPVLDYTKEYVLGVSELCVPLGDEPMLTQVPATENLIAVHRKGYYAPDAATGMVQTWFPVYYGELRANAIPHVHVGHPHAGAALVANGNVLPMNIIGSTWTKLKAHYKGTNIQTPSQFYDELNKWIASLNVRLDAMFAAEHASAALGNNVGVAPTCNLKAVVSPAGRISIRGSADFWKLCYFDLTPYGQVLLGTKTCLLHVGPNQGTTAEAGVFTEGLTEFNQATGLPLIAAPFNAAESAFVNPGVIGGPHVTRVFQYSALRYMESRLRIEVDADLSIPANILVENGKQKMHYNIASFALPNRYKSEIVLNQADDQVQEETCIITESHVGDVILKDKLTPVSDWYRLQDSSNLQNMRLHIFVVRRDWDASKSEFTLVRNRLRMSNMASWKLTLKFVQLF